MVETNGNNINALIYFRKDCQFHDFVNDNSDWENFVNTNKVYLYFGKIFPDTTENFFNVIFYGMKDYVVDALPENNRTDRFTEFLQVSFDQQYQEIYNRLKNIPTLSDPKETDSDYLYYIGNMFDMTIHNLLGDIPSQRAWVENLHYLLKRVGTYTALNIIWRSIIGGTSNFLNIYERWHPVIDPEDIPYPYFEDYLYTANPIYGGTVAVGPAGEGFYHSLETTGSGGYPTNYSWPAGKILSPHYKVQMDLSGEPFGADYIINENIMDNLLEYWEEVRPVARVSHYQQLISPLTHFGPAPTSLYGGAFSAFLFTRCTKPLAVGVVAATAVYSRMSLSSIWDINHNLRTETPIVQCYNPQYERMYPARIETISSNHIRIYWGENSPMNGHCFVAVPEYTQTILGPSAASWNIDHTLSDKYPIVQLRETNFDVFMPLSVTIVDDDTLTATFSSVQAGSIELGQAAYVYHPSGAQDTWVISHGLDAYGLHVEVYDENNELIVPKNIQINTTSRCTVTFSSAVSGTAVVREIGQTFSDMDGMAADISYLGIGNGDDTRHWDAQYYGALKSLISTHPTTLRGDSSYYYITSTVPQTSTDLTITEIGLYNLYDDLVWYTACSPIFKPANVELKIFYRIELAIK